MIHRTSANRPRPSASLAMPGAAAFAGRGPFCLLQTGEMGCSATCSTRRTVSEMRRPRRGSGGGCGGEVGEGMGGSAAERAAGERARAADAALSTELMGFEGMSEGWQVSGVIGSTTGRLLRASCCATIASHCALLGGDRGFSTPTVQMLDRSSSRLLRQKPEKV